MKLTPEQMYAVTQLRSALEEVTHAGLIVLDGDTVSHSAIVRLRVTTTDDHTIKWAHIAVSPDGLDV